MSLSTESKNIIEVLSVNVPIRKQSVHYEKITDSNFVIPDEKEYFFLEYKNYRVSHLKTICRKYKLKVGGNKDQLKTRIYNFLRLSVKARIIQKILKNRYIKNYNIKHGPARLNRDLCVNDTDFYSMDSLNEIPYENFNFHRDFPYEILKVKKILKNESKILKQNYHKILIKNKFSFYGA